MRIALLGPIAWRTPPRAYGPWEQVVSLLAEGLTARGVDVTVFASLDSLTSARLDGVIPRPYEEDRNLDGRIWESLHVAHCLGQSGEFDLVHNNVDWLPLAFAESWQSPLLTTVHGFSGPRILPAYQHAADHGAQFVSISDADRAEGLPYLATIHHGIETDRFPLVTAPDDYLLAFGRIHPDKGTAEAIDIATRSSRRLVICGPVQDAHYFETQVRPRVDGTRVRYLGNVGPDERARLLGGASALLHPISFAEPFGLSVVEAMMCGTPVIAYPLGSMPELITSGIDGYLVDDLDAAVQAVHLVDRLDRRRISESAAARFSADRMVEDYLAVYTTILGMPGAGHTPRQLSREAW